MNASRRPAPILTVQHEDECPPAWFGEWLELAGARLDVRRPYLGEPLPADLAPYRGLLVLGGAMGANDDADHAWLGPTKQLLRTAVDRAVPTLGICLGHQLLAAATGGRVEQHPQGRQCGLLPVGWTAEAEVDPLFGPLVTAGGYDAPVAVQWNVDVVTVLPPGAVALAHTVGDALQAFRVGTAAWGIQSHPEAGSAIVGAWTESATSLEEADLQLLAALPPAEERLRTAWRRLAVGFAARCGATDVQPAGEAAGRPG